MAKKGRSLRACSRCGIPTRGFFCFKHRIDDRLYVAPYRNPRYLANRAICLSEEKVCWMCGKPGT